MQTISNRGLELIKNYEKFYARRMPYKYGLFIIGYGHVFSRERDFPARITRTVAERILLRDLKSHERMLRRLVRRNLTQGEFDALVSIAHDTNGKAIMSQSMIRRIRLARDRGVVQEFRKWVFRNGKRVPRLVLRRNEELALYNG